ncbi:uncharacterized protein PAC_07870 [Phialocephala subalpina]|uniref:Uncharacterized protein n=1 Tax=Phialocephala subalpina TaxID=576137 RepID=A0A1L7WZ00_9HELO|nr:uncharacterized protein PAC_07870 [Phialocephala subalpina]
MSSGISMTLNLPSPPMAHPISQPLPVSGPLIMSILVKATWLLLPVEEVSLLILSAQPTENHSTFVMGNFTTTKTVTGIERIGMQNGPELSDHRLTPSRSTIHDTGREE